MANVMDDFEKLQASISQESLKRSPQMTPSREMKVSESDAWRDPGDMPLIEVDQNNGPHKTIQEAIDAAPAGSQVLIHKAVYKENLRITKKLFLNAESGTELVMNDMKAPIRLDLSEQDTARIQNLTISLVREEEDQSSKKNIDTKLALQNETIGRNPQEEFIVDQLFLPTEKYHKFPIENDVVACILVCGGRLLVRNCFLEVNFAPPNKKSVGIAATMSKVVVKGCQITGKKDVSSIGVLVKKTAFHMKKSIVRYHRWGGVFLRNHEEKDDAELYYSKIEDSQIFGNGRCGVFCEGKDSAPDIVRNTISENEGAGVVADSGNQAKIKGNDIQKNQVGILMQSCSTFCFLNHIHKNLEAGIVARTALNLPCDGSIKSNEINDNEFGIRCMGTNCLVRIEHNRAIRKNLRAGIRIEEFAHPSIIKNRIYNNFKQGILMIETGSAFIEKNSLHSNEKANIALGGRYSEKTSIIKNDISTSSAEGIFVIDGARCWIRHNRIHKNNDGIVMLSSKSDAIGNEIFENERAGLFISKFNEDEDESMPHVEKNLIYKNGIVGLIIKNGETEKIIRNKIFMNPCNMGLDDYVSHKEDDLYMNNDIRNRKQRPACSIF